MTIYDIRVQKGKKRLNQGKTAIFCPFLCLLATSSKKYDIQVFWELPGSSKTYADVGLNTIVARIQECPPRKPLCEGNSLLVI